MPGRCQGSNLDLSDKTILEILFPLGLLNALKLIVKDAEMERLQSVHCALLY